VNLDEILKGAFGVYRRYPGSLFLVGAPVMPVTIAGILLTSDTWFLNILVLPIAFGVLAFVPVAALVRTVADALGGTEPAFWRSYRAALSQLGRLIFAALRYQTIVQVLIIVVVGLPLAIYLAIRWFFFPQAIILEGAAAGEALKRSGDLVSGSWWRVTGIALVIGIMYLIPGAFVTFVLFPGPPGGFDGVGLLSAPAGVSAAVIGVIGAILLPFAVGAETILFLDLRARHGRAAMAA
jgi:hypothetical protein